MKMGFNQVLPEPGGVEEGTMAFGAGTWNGSAAAGGRERSARGQLGELRWLATIVPAVAIFMYETARHATFERLVPMPEAYGNLFTGLLTLLLSFWFSRSIFASVHRIQDEAVEETRRAAVLASMVEERERLSRELHDGLAQVTSYLLVRLDTVRNLVESGRSAAATAELVMDSAYSKALALGTRDAQSPPGRYDPASGAPPARKLSSE